MNKTFAICAVLVSGFFARAVTLETVSVVQRYPWNGIVDIDYRLGYEEGENAPSPANTRLVIRVIDQSVDPAVTNIASMVDPVPLSLEAGTHRATWNALADGISFASDDVKVEVAFCTYHPKYMVVDVSGGKDALTYPVTYFADEPNGGFNAEAYKGDGIVFRLIPQGSFIMGAPAAESQSTTYTSGREVQHPVTLTRPYYIGLFEITQKQYFNVTGADPSDAAAKGDYRPVEKVSYCDIRGTNKGSQWPDGKEVDETSFVGLLSKKTGLSFDLPTDAQWEYACRAGTTSSYSDGSTCTSKAGPTESLKLIACYTDNPGIDGKDAVVGSFAANPWGLYDMHGNVWEWCRDYALDALDTLGLRRDPEGPMLNQRGGIWRIWRGGAYDQNGAYCRSALRWYDYKDPNSLRAANVGFRLVCELPEPEPAESAAVPFEQQEAVGAFSPEGGLDLSETWERTDFSAVGVNYSAVGWDIDEVEDGSTVELKLTETTAGAEQTLVSGLAGRGVWTWTPVGMEKSVYRLDHLVSRGGAVDASRTLQARFSFRNASGGRPAAEDLMAAVVAGISGPFSIENGDADNFWGLIGGAGDGISSPSGKTASCAFVVDGGGRFAVSFRMTGGSVSIQVDGVEVEVVSDPTEGWVAREFAVDGRGRHVIAFVAASAGEGVASLKGAKWSACDEIYARDESEPTAVDFRDSPRIVLRRAEWLPLTYSSTNFTGLAGADASSIARVTVMRVTGDGDDIASWPSTNVVSGSEKVIRCSPGEGAVKWRACSGVWKTVFEVLDGENVLHAEESLFDARQYCHGFMFIVR